MKLNYLGIAMLLTTYIITANAVDTQQATHTPSPSSSKTNIFRERMQDRQFAENKVKPEVNISTESRAHTTATAVDTTTSAKLTQLPGKRRFPTPDEITKSLITKELHLYSETPDNPVMKAKWKVMKSAFTALDTSFEASRSEGKSMTQAQVKETIASIYKS